MKQTGTFTMRISPMERKVLARLAQLMNRSQSDAVRRMLWICVKAIEQANAEAGESDQLS